MHDPFCSSRMTQHYYYDSNKLDCSDPIRQTQIFISLKNHAFQIFKNCCVCFEHKAKFIMNSSTIRYFFIVEQNLPPALHIYSFEPFYSFNSKIKTFLMSLVSNHLSGLNLKGMLINKQNLIDLSK